MVILLLIAHLDSLDLLGHEGWALIGTLAWLVGTIGLLGIICLLVFLDLNVGLRRQERARCFLHLLEIGARQGRSFEETVVSLARSRIQTLGSRLKVLARHVAAGSLLTDALDRVPGFLPAQIRAMLKTGAIMGDSRKVLAAARQTLRDAPGRAQAEQNNIFIYFFLVPVGAFVVWHSLVFVFPILKEISKDMIGSTPPFMDSMAHWSLYLSIVAMVIWAGFLLAGLLHIGGPRLFSRLDAVLWPATHRIAYWIPWRRKRLQRDFTAMLGLLLDAEVPECQAVELAAASTANRVFLARAERVAADLREGVKLTDALRHLDDAGEFQWRLRNAAYAKTGFAAALAGWKEALEAKAFQQEQTFSQILTTSLVLLNGVMVALVAVGFFGMFSFLIESAVLW